VCGTRFTIGFEAFERPGPEILLDEAIAGTAALRGVFSGSDHL